MSTPRRPHLKSIPKATEQPRSAEPAASSDGRSAPRSVGRKAVPSALRSAPQTGDGRYPIAWLHITAPRGAVPTAHSWCACGHDRSAIGKPRVLALIADHEAHRDTCPLRTPQEGATAA